MIAALCTLSTQGLWILTDPEASSILATRSWIDNDNNGHSSRLPEELHALCAEAGFDIKKLGALAGVAGPGAFTGLRMSASFLKGLSLGLNIPLLPIPTYAMYDHEIFLPLRHLKAAQMKLGDYLGAGYECIKIFDAYSSELATPPLHANNVLGFDSLHLWPAPEALRKGTQWALQHPDPYIVNYGIDPKISGQRTPI